ncbi:MAG TPA: SigB/SigF/SigG family RNA polymerase sigma factor [Pseudonocardia sp.]|nr:SigB/SigF/SigG family RNA polymerase sigma factor [Pseudonocardia sp.]
MVESEAPRARSSSGDTQFDHLEPLLAQFAAIEADTPKRSRLREELVTSYLPLAQRIARRYANRGEPLDDLIQVASLGLLQAIERYQPTLGRHFLAFAVPTITGEIRRYFRDKSWAMRVPRRLKELHQSVSTATVELSQQLDRAPRPSELAEHLKVSTNEILEALEAAHSYRADSLDEAFGSDGSTPLREVLGGTDPSFETFTDLHSLAPHVAELPERDRRILLMRFYQDMTQTQIAEKLGISQMQVSRVLASTLRSLRKAVRDNATDS